jgi:phage portal protein BeeE
MNILTKTAALLGEMKAAYDAPLLKSLNVDYLGRTLPMGTAGARWLGFGVDAGQSGYANHGTAYSIISYILSTCQSIPWAVYKLDSADGKAKPQPKHPLAELLYRPNPRMSWADYKNVLEGGLQLHGEAFVRRIKPEFGSRRGKTAELWPIPGPCMESLPLGVPLGLFDTPTGWRYTDPATGRWEDYPAEDILHLKYWNPTNPHRGLSPIQAGADALTAAKSGLESRVQQYQNQGPAGVVFSKPGANDAADTWTPEQAGRVQSWFGGFFKGGRRFGQVPVVNKDMGYLQMGLSPVDLDVLAAIPHDKDAVADLFHFPGQLLNGSKGTTFANMSEARKALYTTCAVPLETLIRDGHNRWLGQEYSDGVYLDYDLSGIPELQEDKQTLVAWLNSALWVSTQDKQRLLGFEADETLPKYIFPSTFASAEQLFAAADPAPEDAAPVDGAVN